LSTTDKKVKLEIETWDYTCGDGCCYEWGTTLTVNGTEMEFNNDVDEMRLVQVLEFLGYEVEVIHTEKK